MKLTIDSRENSKLSEAVEKEALGMNIPIEKTWLEIGDYVFDDVCFEAKSTTDNFFNNVIVNDENSDIKKNRLKLLQMFCKTYISFIDFSKMEGA